LKGLVSAYMERENESEKPGFLKGLGGGEVRFYHAL